MKIKTIFLVFTLIASSIVFLGNFTDEDNFALADVLYVGNDSKYKTIQDAVNASVPGDLIVIKVGNYNENVTINTNNITIKGNSSIDTRVSTAKSTPLAVFHVTAEWVNITLLNITATADSVCGVLIDGADNCTVQNNTIWTDGDTGTDGIKVVQSQHTRILDNHINVTGTGSSGIYLDDGDINFLINNTIN